jgi:hypothetical protein
VISFGCDRAGRLPYDEERRQIVRRLIFYNCKIIFSVKNFIVDPRGASIHHKANLSPRNRRFTDVYCTMSLFRLQTYSHKKFFLIKNFIADFSLEYILLVGKCVGGSQDGCDTKAILS